MLPGSNARTRRCRIQTSLLLCVHCLAATDGYAEGAPLVNTGTRWLSLSSQDEPGPSNPADEPASTEAEASLFEVDINYAIYSDYIFRGINFSEFRGEGREKPNHQVDLSITADVARLFGEAEGTMGSLTIGTWFEWFAGQRKLDAVSGGQNLQEIDYYLSWSFDIQEIDSTLTLGYTFYTIANAKTANTSEWWFSVEHNDAWLWRGLWPENQDGVLNPSFAFYQDVDAGAGNAIWMELGLNHAFQVAENVTVTPSWILAIDHDYYRHFAGDPNKNTTRLAYMQWGLDITYDLKDALKLPDGWGDMSVSGFLYFNDALGSAENNRIIQDEFFGGISLAWSF